MKGNVKKGNVKWFNPNKGFGFITPEEGNKDIFVHIGQVQTQDRSLSEGQKVEFDVSEGKKGPEAINVKEMEE